ncbi:hypothetical protein C0J52_24305 [Blattella germanica]|nr:hypothetical protein C0J52_24305 [Blattella germanica]
MSELAQVVVSGAILLAQIPRIDPRSWRLDYHVPSMFLFTTKLNVEKYMSENLTLAIEEMRKGSTLRAAAAKFGIPMSTLHDHHVDDEGADSLSTPSSSSRLGSTTRVSSSESESDSDNEICDEATNRGRHKKDFQPKREQHLGHSGLNVDIHEPTEIGNISTVGRTSAAVRYTVNGRQSLDRQYLL